MKISEKERYAKIYNLPGIIHGKRFVLLILCENLNIWNGLSGIGCGWIGYIKYTFSVIVM